MNTTTKTDQAFVTLWHQKLDAEREMALLVAQDRTVDADAAWERVLEICTAIRHHRATR